MRVEGLLLGAVAGAASTAAMDRATAFMYERQGETARTREKELRDDPMPSITLARKAAAVAGVDLTDPAAARFGKWLHYGLGALGGIVAVGLARRGWPALRAGVAAGAGLALAFDEGASYALGLAAPAREWPPSTHARGIAAHLFYGAVLGSLIGAGQIAAGAD